MSIMLVVIFTPTHPGTHAFLGQAADSIERAAERIAEPVVMAWSVLVNGGGIPPEIPRQGGARVYSHVVEGSGRIGGLKKLAVTHPQIDATMRKFSPRDVVLVELDADDLLHPDALLRAVEAFNARPELQMFYGDCAHFRAGPGGWRAELPFQPALGWESYAHRGPGLELVVNKQWPVGPDTLSSILFSPDHLRVYRLEGYEAVGGHADLPICDDHDLTQRLFLRYGYGAFARAQECLYYYRRHDEQRTTAKGVDDIQAESRKLWQSRGLALALKHARDQGWLSVDLGSTAAPAQEFDRYYDLHAGPGVEPLDLTGEWPLRDSSCYVIRASHVLEHLADPHLAMAKAWRALTHGGLLFLEVPLATGAGAFMDPTHKSFWAAESLAYYTDPHFARWISGTPQGFALCATSRRQRYAQFQTISSEVGTLQLAGSLSDRNVPVLRAVLAAIKDPSGFRIPGRNFWQEWRA